MIDGRTRLVGILGWPVDHSFSPGLHNAAFDAMGLNWRYVPLPVPPGQVFAAVKGLAAMGFLGANVTVPHKQAVLPVLDALDETATALGAVNTLVFSRSETGTPRITGHNTDARGFSQALESGGLDIGPRTRAVVVGAGGAARAVIFALASSHVGEITVFSRTPGRAQALVAEFSGRQPASHVTAQPLTDDCLLTAAQTAVLLVNATPVGMWPRGDDSISAYGPARPWPPDRLRPRLHPPRDAPPGAGAGLRGPRPQRARDAGPTGSTGVRAVDRPAGPRPGHAGGGGMRERPKELTQSDSDRPAESHGPCLDRN